MTQLKRIIKGLGITQEQVAESSGIFTSRLSLILNGKVKPSASEAEKLADFFGSSIPELMEISNE